MRSAFDKMGVKMDNIITGQQALEVKLDLINQQFQSNKGDIEQLKKTAEFVSEQLKWGSALDLAIYYCFQSL